MFNKCNTHDVLYSLYCTRCAGENILTTSNSISEGTKADSNKPAVQFLPPLATLEVGKAFSAGAKKYGHWNYRNGLAATRCVGGALRHTFQWMAGEDYDKETGAHHLASAVANLLMALENVLLYPAMDDRHKPNSKQ